jgi:hypothetical protein
MKKRLLTTTIASVIGAVGINQQVASGLAESHKLPISETKIFISQAPPKPSTQPLETPPQNSVPPSLLDPQIEITKSKIEVVNPGSEPRRKLRFRVPDRRRETANLVLKTSAKTTLADNPTPPVNLPINVIQMETEVTKVEPNGDMQVKFRYPSVQVVAVDDKVSPDAVKLMRTTFSKLTNLQGELVLDERGQTKSSKFSLPAQSDPILQQLSSQLTNSFNQVSSPIPEEAIGKGAKWRATNYVKASGIKIEQVAYYHLTSLQDNVATIDIKMEQKALPQVLELPGLPPDLAVNLISFDTQGRGRLRMSLDRLLPLNSTILLNSKGEMSVKIPNSDRELNTKIETSMDMLIRSQ